MYYFDNDYDNDDDDDNDVIIYYSMHGLPQDYLHHSVVASSR